MVVVSVQRRRGRLRCASSVIALVAVVAVGPSAVAAACWRPPVEAVVSDPFRPPACPWCPGNRGLEFATRRGDPVTAVVAGRVTYAGSIAGVVHVVTTAPSGLRITYGRLLTTPLAAGDVVLAGGVVGTAREGFHFGVRRGEEYLDPAPLLGRPVRRPRLVPADDSAAAPAPPPRLDCGAPPVPGRFVVIPPRIR